MRASPAEDDVGKLRVIADQDAWDLELSASSRIGRHWSCDLVIPVIAAPLYWLELRWREDHWSWRPLAGEDRTRGTGSSEPGDFRSWAAGTGRVRLDGCGYAVEASLVEASSPRLAVEDLDTRKRLAEGDAERVIEVWPDGRAWPLGSDPARDLPLVDGAVFVLDGRSWRAHMPGTRLDTTPATLDVADPRLRLAIDPSTLHATFTVANREAVLTAECVRVLCVYARARVRDGREGGDGWVGAPAAWASWVELGGRRTSPIDRLAWERGKLRTRLAAQGVGGLERLFETRGAAGSTEVRLALDPEHIAILGSPE